jgi:hypothetical protein
MYYNHKQLFFSLFFFRCLFETINAIVRMMPINK